MKKRFKRERFWVKPIFYYEWKSMERYEKTITKFGTGAKIDAPKEFIGKKVYILVRK